MDSLRSIVARGVVTDNGSGTNSDSVVNLMIALLVLIFFGLLSFALLILLRRVRRQKQMMGETLPQYHEIKRTGSNGNHRRLTITTNGPMGRSSVIVFKDGQPMLANPSSPPHSPDNVPEIHITFPDEQDDQGRRKSGRVVVVRVGDNSSVGLEPLHEEQLPAYEKESKTQFYAIDIDKIGGLKEKEFH
ncbi:hypothetical protein QBC46DRAFT_163288 [Diplogelasinospora grovesii]|uniref:Uncharacterized protein n=1 Tax=Diplogelasinospora grovesii TaxID=303347 RepID=A0AAN6N4P8_9PEZI|nr:hypothetical protein QBC46DRAFT_163288 [Diplogelasinospora grovesii]